MGERVHWNEDGSLDEIAVDGGAHLEHMGDGNWWVAFYRSDGTSICIWFKSKSLSAPDLFWEEREAPKQSTPELPNDQ